MVLAACGGGTSSGPASTSTPGTTSAPGTTSGPVTTSDTGVKSDPSDRNQVSESFWTSNITQLGLFGRNSNLTLNITGTASGQTTSLGLVENANGRLHLFLEDGGEAMDVYVDTLDNGSYDYYTVGETGEWEKYNVPAAYAQMIAGLYTSFVQPWAYSDFTYDTASHSYKKESDTIILEEGVTLQLSNIEMKFEDSKFISLTYDGTSGGQTGTMSIIGSKWGTTTVTLPTVTPISSEPGPDSSGPRPDSSVPGPDTSLPGPDSSVPGPDSSVPGPDSSIPGPDSSQPGHDSSDTPAFVSVTSIRLNQKTLTLDVGGTETLVATVLPENATDKSVEWSSSNDLIATVIDGLVIGVSSGDAVIYAKAGDMEAFCNVHVNEEDISVDNPFVGVTLKYKANSFDEGSFAYVDPDFNNEKLEAHMATVTISMFDDGKTPNGAEAGTAVEKATFEMVSRDAEGKVNYAYVGTYDADVLDFYNEIEINAYYSGITGKWYHGMHMARPDQLAFTVNGGFSYNDETGLYYMSTYLYNAEGVVAKGLFAFEKVNDEPAHVSDLPTDPHDDNYEEVLMNKVYRYESLTLSDPTADKKLYETAYAKSYIAIFDEAYAEAYFEYQVGGGEAQPTLLAWRGYYEVTDVADDSWTITFLPYEVVKDGVVHPIEGTTFTYVYDVKNAVLVYSPTVAKDLVANIIYKPAKDEVPTAYVPVLPDKWDEEAVAAAFTSIGVTETLPKFANAKTFVIGNQTETSFVITLVLGSGSSSLTAYAEYLNNLADTYGFVYNSNDGEIFYMSPLGQFKLTTDYEKASGKVILKVEKHVVYYPETEIAEYLGGFGYTDPIVDFRADGITNYDFEDGYLYALVGAGTNADTVLAAYVELLGKAQFKTEVSQGKTFYTSPNRQYGLYLAKAMVEGSGLGFVVVVIVDAESIGMKEYPAQFVASELEGVTDQTINFSSELADEYFITRSTPERPVAELMIYSDQGDEIMNDFEQQLELLGYNKATAVSLYYESADGEGIHLSFQETWVSPDNQVAFNIWGTAKSEDYPGYCSVCIINLGLATEIDLQGEAWEEPVAILSIYAYDYTDTYNVGDEFSFDGKVEVIYNNGEVLELSEEDYVLSGLPDMTEAGTYMVYIIYTVDEEVFETTIDIKVNEVVPQLVTYQYNNIDTEDIYAYDATFLIWAWGGQYGEGTWVEIQRTARKNFVFQLYDDCEGFKIVRLNPKYNPLDPEAEWEWNNTTVWGETGNLTPVPPTGELPTFHFYDIAEVE